MFWFNAGVRRLRLLKNRFFGSKTKAKTPSPPEPVIKLTLDNAPITGVTRRGDELCFHISGAGIVKYLQIRLFNEVIWTSTIGNAVGIPVNAGDEIRINNVWEQIEEIQTMNAMHKTGCEMHRNRRFKGENMTRNVRTGRLYVSRIMLGMCIPLLRAAHRHAATMPVRGNTAEDQNKSRRENTEACIQEVGAMLHDRAFRSENLDHFRRRLYALGAYNRSRRVPGSLEAPVS